VNTAQNALGVELSVNEGLLQHIMQYIYTLVENTDKFRECHFVNPIKNGTLKLLMNNKTICYNEKKEVTPYLDKSISFAKLIISPLYIWRTDEYCGVHISVCQLQSVLERECFSFIEQKISKTVSTIQVQLRPPPPPPPPPPFPKKNHQIILIKKKQMGNQHQPQKFKPPTLNDILSMRNNLKKVNVKVAVIDEVLISLDDDESIDSVDFSVFKNRLIGLLG
jgi:hypothetical protein